MKIRTLIPIFLFLCTIINAGAEVTLGFRGEEAAGVGIYVKNLRTGEVIAENDSRRAMVPASVMKSVTAATALSVLGRDFRFTTPVYLYGKRNDSDRTCWDGNLVIEGNVDPTIDSELFDDRESLADEILRGLRAQGICRINGKIVISESLQQAGCVPQWEIDDVAWAYGAGLFGFNFQDNKFRLYPATGKSVPVQPGLKLSVRGDADGSGMLRGILSDYQIVSGRNPDDRRWVLNSSMPDPAEAYKTLLAERLRRASVEVTDAESDDEQTRALLCEHLSPVNTEILRQMMFESHNMFAEAMLRALEPDGTRDEAIKRLRRLWDDRGLSVDCNYMADGSGLARADRLQPVFLANVLEYMAKSADADTYVSLFPKAGRDGTVRNLLRNTALEGKLALKSGSMNGVQCFAGYKLDSAGHPTHVVVVMINSFFCPRAQVREGIEKFLLKTFK